MMNDDMELVREYATNRSEQAFETLVSRHLSLVYSAALRQVRDPQTAEEITQTVFIVLARKAGSLRPGTILPGWLYRTTRYVSAASLRIRHRRERREQEAHMLSTPNEVQSDDAWEQLGPLLDEAMAQLRDQDRDAIVLRYFQNKSLREVGAALGVDEYAAQKRVGRALEKLRLQFARKGFASTTAAIAGAVAAHSVQSAPAALAKSTVAIAKGTAVSSSTLNLLQGALKLMAWTKAKTAIVFGAGLLLAAGTATVTVHEIHEHEAEQYPWQVNTWSSTRDLDAAPPLLKIVPTKFPNSGSGMRSASGKLWGLNYDLANIVGAAYGAGPVRTILATDQPQKRYDYIVSLPSGQVAALQQLIREQFGITARFETMETNVLLLKVKHASATGLRPSSGTGVSFGEMPQNIQSRGQSGLSGLASWLERKFEIVVIDQTDVTNPYDYELKWGRAAPEAERDVLRKALMDQLGLELVSGRAPVKMLIVEKAQ